MSNVIIQDFSYISSSNLPFNKLKDSTILISGASGFIASYLVKFLLTISLAKKLNLKVIGIVRDKNKAEKIFGKHKNLKLVVQDICDPLNIKGKVDIIIHSASISSPKYFRDNPIDTLGANIFGTYNLLKLAGDKKIKEFIFFSSGGVYGETRGVTKEIDYGYLDPLDSRSCYHESKRMGETMCMAWFTQKKTPIKIIRPFHIYGVGMSLTDGRAIADFITDVLKNKDITIKSNGSSVRSFCYIADFTLGLLTVLLKGKNGEAYNITNDKSRMNIGQLAKMIARLFPIYYNEEDYDVINTLYKRDRKVIFTKRDEKDSYLISRVKDNNPNVDKLKALGWTPNYSLREGFKRTIESFL